MRSILLLTLTLLAPLAHAARVEVVLPSAGDIEVTDQFPPETGPRIACPPNCTYERPGSGTGISALSVRVKPDPETDDPAWDVISIDGCTGTSTLPADSGVCYLGSGDARVVVNLRYRPLVAITGAGTIGAPLGFLFVNVGPGPGYQGSGSGYACDLAPPISGRCASHYSFGQPISVSTGTSSKATLVDWSGPCEGAGNPCVFQVLADTCITAQFTNSEPPEFPKQTLDGPRCPTGNPGPPPTTPTTTPTSTTTTTTTTLPDYLDQLIDDIVDSIPFSGPLGLRGTAPSAGVIRVRMTTSSPGTTRGLAAAQATREVVVAKGTKKVRRAGEFTLKIKPTKKGRRLVKDGVVFLAVVQAELKTKAGVDTRSRFVPVTP